MGCQQKDYHVRNKRERAFEEMRNILDIDVAEIKAKITSLRAQSPLYSHLKTQHVVTCCERLHTSANIAQQETTLLAPIMLPVVASVCTGLKELKMLAWLHNFVGINPLVVQINGISLTELNVSG